MLLLLVLLLSIYSTWGYTFSRTAVLKPFVDGKALKIISGLQTFDPKVVSNVVSAASAGGATHVDIACDPDLVRLAKTIGSLPVCVSAVDPALFGAAVEAGADMLEIGNYDGFYPSGRLFTAETVLKMASETRRLHPSMPLSVTIPHLMSLEEQVALAQQLQQHADVIQTEGKWSADPYSMGMLELIQRASPTIATAHALSRAIHIPVLCSSGLTDVTVPMALSAGAKGVGVGSMVSRQATYEGMYQAVCALANAMGSAAKEEQTQAAGAWFNGVRSVRFGGGASAYM